MNRRRDVSIYLLLLFLGMILASSTDNPNLRGATATNPDFSISANPTSVIVNPGPQGNSTITLASQQGFVGRVNMTVGVSPHGLYCQLTETSLNVTLNGPNSTTLHCDGFPGIFTVTVAGNATIAGTAVSHLVSVSYVVTDFSLSANPPSIEVQPGHEASTRVTISSQQAFAQNIYLNLTLPSGIDASITPNILSGPGASTLNVDSNVTGVYNLTIIASSGSISHKLWLQVAVTNLPPSLPAGTIFGLQPFAFYPALATLIIVGLAGVAVSFRRRKQIRKRKASLPGS